MNVGQSGTAFDKTGGDKDGQMGCYVAPVLLDKVTLSAESNV